MDQPSRRSFPRWPSFAVLLGAAAYLTLSWDSIPARWIIHWGARGEPNGWATRTIPGVYGLLVLGAIILGVNEGIATTRPPIAAGSALYHARVDSMRIISFGVAMTLAILAIELPLGPPMPVSALLTLGLAPLVAAMGVGFVRLGATLRREREDRLRARSAYRDQPDPENAHRGADELEGYHAFYYANADDKRLWVPKLSGMGWTINFSHPLGWPMFVLILMVPIAAVVLSATAR